MAFAVAHLIYASAFGLRPLKLPIACFTYALALPTGYVYFHLAKDYYIKHAGPLYAIIIFTMAWRAATRLSIFNEKSKFSYSKLYSFIGKSRVDCGYVVKKNKKK